MDQRELESLGFLREGRARIRIDIHECVWSNDRDETLAIAVDPKRDLLVDSYRAQAFPIRVPTAVDGLPALKQRARSDDNDCTLTTALGLQQTLEVEWSGLSNRQTQDPCVKAEEATALVVRKFPPQR